MTAPRLVYRNSTPEIMAWVSDYKQRTQAVATARWQWMKELYDAHGVPDGDEFKRQAWARGTRFTGITWPEGVALPDGWFRPVKEPHLIRPRANVKAGRAARAEIEKFHRPDARAELRERFGMDDHVFAGSGLYSNGLQFEEDGVWATWASRDVADELGDGPAKHGWVRVPLVEYIERFGEDAL